MKERFSMIIFLVLIVVIAIGNAAITNFELLTGMVLNVWIIFNSGIILITFTLLLNIVHQKSHIAYTMFYIVSYSIYLSTSVQFYVYTDGSIFGNVYAFYLMLIAFFTFVIFTSISIGISKRT